MYNEEKKIITDIGRKKNLEENLPKYVSCMKSADYEYAVSKFALNFFTVKEMLEDKKEKIEPEIVSFIMGINKLVNTYVAGKCGEVDPKDMLLVSDMRNKVTARMKVLTAYTDAFELYEYILNRKEFGFEENVTEEVEKMFSEYDVDAFSQEIYNFIFADKDKIAIPESVIADTNGDFYVGGHARVQNDDVGLAFAYDANGKQKRMYGKERRNDKDVMYTVTDMALTNDYLVISDSSATKSQLLFYKKSLGSLAQAISFKELTGKEDTLVGACVNLATMPENRVLVVLSRGRRDVDDEIFVLQL